MSTLTVDNESTQHATETAAAEGKTVDEFVDEALRQVLFMVGARRTVRNGLPVIVVSDDTPRIDPAKVRQCLEEEFWACRLIARPLYICSTVSLPIRIINIRK